MRNCTHCFKDINLDTEDHILLLMQMADSSFPVGGFAYSYGLESAVKHGFFADQEMLRKYLITFSNQIISFDFAFISTAYLLESNSKNLNFTLLAKSYDAMVMCPLILKANKVMGKNWFKLCKQIFPVGILDEFESKEMVKDYSFPLIFGKTLQLVQIKLKSALQLYFYMAIRDQMSAIIRLGVAGPTRAHMELKFLADLFKEKIDNYIPQDYTKAYKTGYLLDIAQLSHDKVYSKLFQN